ncbi:unnamed protein product [Mytilus edulis]|uniref:Death domain-containing protein n=1 Tax=Mytilus edulis TaxID=6550 RepID=A0A8S3VIN9_MYTED|nr:unnamed protein product [Mytilus edulis]
MYQSFDNRVFLAGACNSGKSTLASVLIGDDIPQTWKSTDGLVVYFGRNGIHLKTGEMVPLKDGIKHICVHKCRRVEPNDIPDVSKLDHYTVREDILEEVRKGRYLIDIAPSDLVDFGGQRSYDMTHQLFIQYRGSFIIMFDGRYELNTPLMEYPQRDVTSEALIMHWINSILTYCSEGDDIMPMVLFAATHSDYFTSRARTKKHMFLDTVYFINGTNNHDPEIKALTQQLVRFAMQQSTWGQKRPMAWVPLELQIDKMRSQNSNIITRNQLEYINRLNEDLALTEGQLEDFLQNQHKIGKVMYYKQPGLDGFVIIHTPALVNIMRSFITDEMFWPDNAELKEILQNLVLTGNIYKSNLWKLWRQDSFNQYLPTDELKAFVTKLLIHLDILIQPNGYNLASADEDSSFHVCDSNTIVLTYDLAITSIPSALAFKVIGAASNNLLLKEEDGKQCLFHKAAIFMVDDDNEIRMCLEDNRVMVNLVNRKSLQFLSPDIAASVQECLTKTLESSIAFYYRSNGKQIDPKEVSNKITIEVGVVCNNSVCLLNLNDASQGTEWTCITGLDITELKTIPSNKHLVRLASKFGISLFGEFIIHMGLETQEYCNIQHQYEANGVHSVMFMAMIFREDTSLNDVSESRLQSTVDDDVLTELPKHIGNCVIHLGIELGLTVEDIEATMYNYPKDMYSQIASVLRIWKTSSQTPTVFALMKALQHVKSGGLSYLCQRYNVCAQD